MKQSGLSGLCLKHRTDCITYKRFILESKHNIHIQFSNLFILMIIFTVSEYSFRNFRMNNINCTHTYIKMGSKKQLPNFWLKRSFTCSLNCLAFSTFGTCSFSSPGKNCQNSMRIKHKFPPPEVCLSLHVYSMQVCPRASKQVLSLFLILAVTQNCRNTQKQTVANKLQNPGMV